MISIVLCIALDPPDIDEAASRSSFITTTNKRAKIGSNVFVPKGYDVIIDCNIVGGTPPINITWFRNGSPYPTEGSTSTTITITDPRHLDVFRCRADNIIGFDSEQSTLMIQCCKCIS